MGDIMWGPATAANAAARGCTVLAQCPGDAQSQGQPVYRYVGEDVYQRLETSGGVTVVARRPNCQLPAGQCKVTLRDPDGNESVFTGEGLDEGGPQAPQQQIQEESPRYVPLDPDSIEIAPRGGNAQDSILNSPTRMQDPFYMPYEEDMTPNVHEKFHTERGTDAAQAIERQFAEPTHENVAPGLRDDVAPRIPGDELTSESVRLDSGENPERGQNRVDTAATNPVTTFVESDADGVKDVMRVGGLTGDEVELGGDGRDEDGNAARKMSFVFEPPRDVDAIADDMWTEDPRTTEVRAEVRENLSKVSDDLAYLQQLERNELCVAQCQGESVYRENQLRILRAIEDEASRGYVQLLSAAHQDALLPAGGDGNTNDRYVVVLHDARGETFYCTTSGTCTPTDTFEPARPRQSPIALVEAPAAVERVVTQLRYTGTPVSYALNEIAESGASVLQRAIAPVPAFAPRPGYPACSLLTSLIGACVYWM